MKHAVTVHADKIDFYLPNTVQNADALADHFHDLARAWTDKLGLQWKDRAKILDREGGWKDWAIIGANSDIEILVRGRAYHLTEVGRRTRLFRETHWLQAPFPSSRDRQTMFRHHGRVRITDLRKNDPVAYTASLSTLLRQLEPFQITDFPKEIEISIDCTDRQMASALRQTLRLKWANHIDLAHFRSDLQGHPFPGPSLDGDREYSQFRGYPEQGLRQLVCYPRWVENGYHRFELRVGPRSLRRFYGSKTFLRALSTGEARHVRSNSPTLQVLAMIPNLLKRNLMLELIDLDGFFQDYPKASQLGLDRLSVRGQYHRLVSLGMPAGVVGRYTRRLAFPPMIVVTPLGTIAFNTDGF